MNRSACIIFLVMTIVLLVAIACQTNGNNPKQALFFEQAKPYVVVEEANLVNEDPVRTASLWLITSEDASGFEEYAQTAAQAVSDLYHRYGRDYTSVILVPSADIRTPSYAHASFAADGRGPAGMTGSAPAVPFYWKVRAADRELNEQEKAIASLWAARQQDFPPKNIFSSLSYDEDALRQYIAGTLNIPCDEVQMPKLDTHEYDLPQRFINETDVTDMVSQRGHQ